MQSSLTRPPSILILNRVFPPYSGATGRMACDIALHWRKKGHPVTIVTSAPTPTVDKAKNLTVIRIKGAEKPNGSWSYLKILRKMYKAAKNLPKHDIVISMTDPPLLARYGHKIARKMRAKHIHWSMDIYPELFNVIGNPIHPLAYRYIEGKMRDSLQQADAIVTIGKCMSRHLTHKSISKRKIHIIENWPETELMDNKEAPSSPLFQDSDGHKFRVLYAGNIGLAHDFKTILKVAAFCQKKHPEIEFVFVGRGRGLDLLAKKKAQAGLDNIRLIPPQPLKSVKSMMEAGDIHLVTMKDGAEGLLLPCKFYSSCAVGRPIIYIGPKESNLHNIIQTKECGTSIRNNDASELARAILSYRNDSEQWFTHAANAKKIIDNSPNHNFKQWDDLIASFR
jgi:colanic acid biosynthesis glycosyl transferase WcaI